MATKSSSLFHEKFKSLYYPLRNSSFIYKYVLNFANVLKWFHLNRTQRDGNSLTHWKILDDLNVQGIAFTTLEELFPDKNYLKSMQEWIAKNEVNLRTKQKKKFLLSYFGREDNVVELDVSNPFFDFYLNDKVIFLVSSYLGYVPQLNYLTVEKTIPIEKNTESSHSQNWHRDPEERRTVKVFIYVNDVDDTNGPFVYVKKSQPSGKSIYSKFAPQKLPYGSYPDERLLSARVSHNDVVTAVGKAGTVIFCDTAGLHKGGLSFSGERVMATAFYPSKKWSEPSLISIPINFNETGISSVALNILKRA